MIIDIYPPAPPVTTGEVYKIYMVINYRGVIDHTLTPIGQEGQKKGERQVKGEELLVAKGDGQIEAFLFESLF